MKIKQNIKTIVLTKTMKRLCWGIILILSVFEAAVFSKEWNGIVPCVSTRSDAEKVLGKDRFPYNLGSYRYDNFRVWIFYDGKDENNPDKDVVQRINVYPNDSIVLKKYIKKIPNFYRDFLKTELDRKTSHVNGLTIYRNGKEGFAIWVQKNDGDVEVITEFEYSDPAYDCSKRLSDK